MLDLQPIRARLHPTFRPFIIRMSDGRRIDVPDYLFVAIGRRVVSVIDQDDGVHTLRVTDIATVEDVQPNPEGT